MVAVLAKNYLTEKELDILKGAGKISHEQAIHHVKTEYSKYKDRMSLKPSEVEMHYLESIKGLEQISVKE